MISSVDARVLFLSTCSFFAMISFFPTMVGASKIIEDLGYNQFGFYMISITLLSFGLSSPLTSVFIRRFGAR
jgi:hypothetical protein